MPSVRAKLDLMLKKCEIFRQVFDDFDYDKIAGYGESDVERILNTEGMIRATGYGTGCHSFVTACCIYTTSR